MKQTSAALSVLIEAQQRFASERGWEPYHSLKNLSMALCVEAAELQEIFQWSDCSERWQDMDTVRQQALKDEAADVFLYLLRICELSDIDLIEAAQNKMRKNAVKYPKPEAKPDARSIPDL